MLKHYFHITNTFTMGYTRAIFFSITFFAFFSCFNTHSDDVRRDTTINILTSFNNLFLDSLQLEKFSDFYKERNYEYAWFDSSGLGEQAGNFMNLVSSSVSDLQDSSLYNARLDELYKRFSSNGKEHTQAELLNTELSLTGGFFAYAAKMYKGTDSNIADLGWFIPRKKVNLSELLGNMLSTKKQAEDEDPSLDGYKKLKAFLPFYTNLKNEGNWDSIPVQ